MTKEKLAGARAFAASTAYPKGARALVRDLLAELDSLEPVARLVRAAQEWRRIAEDARCDQEDDLLTALDDIESSHAVTVWLASYSSPEKATVQP